MLKKTFILVFFMFIVAMGYSSAADVCGEIPLFLGRYTAPDILIITDLSGSMAWGLRPDWSPVFNPNENYEGFYNDNNLNEIVFRRQFIYWENPSYFRVVSCYQDTSSINDTPINGNLCTNDNGLYSVPPDSVFIDESLNLYGIADWNNNNWPYPDEYNGIDLLFSHRNCNPGTHPSFTYIYPNKDPCERFMPGLYEADTAVIGKFLNTMRIEVVTQALEKIIDDSSLAIGLGFFKSDFETNQDYTRIYTGISSYSEDHINMLLNTIENIAHQNIEGCTNCYRVNVGGGTPFSPSIVAAQKYFAGAKTDLNGSTYFPRICAKKFVIFLTDGVGNIDSSVENVRERTRNLVQSGVTPIAVGFNLPQGEDEQLRAMAEVANQEADGEETYALHRDQDGDGTPDPFIARNPTELAETLKSIIYEIKQTVFNSGTGTARKTNLGNIIIETSFDVTEWTGEIKTGYLSFNCANCHNPENVRFLAKWNYFKDEDGDNRLDLVNEDKDGDGKLDTVYEDINNNGVLDPGEDIDGDGHLDINEDVDGDGHLDSPESIDWEALKSFLTDVDQIKAKMGEDASKNYSAAKIDTIISILKGERDEKEWWSIDGGWSSSSTLTCRDANSRKIKYGTEMKDFSGSVPPLSEEQVSFIRGEIGCNNTYNNFRSRSKPLGDIINSKPAVWNNLVWIAANDGMLHAFDLNTGEEKIAYIPQSVINKFGDVGYYEKNYCHAFLFDGSPAIHNIEGDDILIVGLGRGGAEYLALDITNAPNSLTFKWSFTDPDLGEAWQQPTIAKCEDGSWIALLSSGYPENDSEWTNKKAFLYAIKINDGTQIAKISLSNEGMNMSSPATPVYLDSIEGLDYVYVGDLKGNLWRLKDCNLADKCQVLNLGDNHPITVKSAVISSSGKLRVYLGTGKYWDINDLSDISNQYLVGFQDDPNNCSQSNLTEISPIISGNTILPPIDCNIIGNGWKILLRPGERVITPPVVFGSTVLFTTFVPSGDQCSGGGDTWLYTLDYKNVCLSSPRIDINDDGKIDNQDLVDGKVPLGIYIGPGVPTSEPVLINDNLIQIPTTEITKNIRTNFKLINIQKGSWTDFDVPIN